MESPKVPREFVEVLQTINGGLFVVWNSLEERFQIMYRNKEGHVRLIRTVESEDGDYWPCDNRILVWLQQNVAWDLLDQYTDPKNMYQVMKERQLRNLNKKREARKDYLRWWNKDHRTWWKRAKENAQSGVMSAPVQHERKIYSWLSDAESKAKKDFDKSQPRDVKIITST